MTERSNNLRVGIFVAIGLLAIALMVVYFGRFGESVRGYYRIRVEYPNASGIYKGASVLLAGAKIGSVEKQSGDPARDGRRLRDPQDLRGSAHSERGSVHYRQLRAARGSFHTDRFGQGCQIFCADSTGRSGPGKGGNRGSAT